MSSAIEKVKVHTEGVTSIKATVTMDFFSWALLHCLLSLKVNASKIEYLAMALFHTRVDVVENVRYLGYRGGIGL